MDDSVWVLKKCGEGGGACARKNMLAEPDILQQNVCVFEAKIEDEVRHGEALLSMRKEGGTHAPRGLARGLNLVESTGKTAWVHKLRGFRVESRSRSVESYVFIYLSR